MSCGWSRWLLRTCSISELVIINILTVRCDEKFLLLKTLGDIRSAALFTCKKADVGLAGLEGTPSLAHHLLPLLLQSRHLNRSKRTF